MNKPLVVLAILTLLTTGCTTTTRSYHHNDSASNHTSRHAFDDATITAKVKTDFINEKIFTKRDIAAMTIHVETVNGVVYLTGTADNRTQLRNAIRVAQSVNGVVRVESSVTIGS